LPSWFSIIQIFGVGLGRQPVDLAFGTQCGSRVRGAYSRAYQVSPYLPGHLDGQVAFPKIATQTPPTNGDAWVGRSPYHQRRRRAASIAFSFRITIFSSAIMPATCRRTESGLMTVLATRAFPSGVARVVHNFRDFCLRLRSHSSKANKHIAVKNIIPATVKYAALWVRPKYAMMGTDSIIPK
jgi:hypothetical protein